MLDPKDLRRTVVIEHVAPVVDGGRYPVKREVGDRVEVSADVFKEGHEFLLAFVKYRRADAPDWRESPMRLVDNDRWAGAFSIRASHLPRAAASAPVARPAASRTCAAPSRSSLATSWPAATRLTRSASQERKGSGSASIVNR